MKHLFLILILSITNPLFAQTKTGGGPIDGTEEKELIPDFMPVAVKFAVLKKILLKIEINCTYTQKVVPANYTFMDSYYNLSLASSIKNLLKKENQTFGTCDLEDTIKRCLGLTELKKIMFLIRNDLDTYKYLESNHGLDKKSADQMMEFFTNPEKN